MVSDIANVVLVHGAWADGSSWNKVITGLGARGIASVAAPLPLTTLANDVAALDRTLERIDAPVVLVGHAYAGAVIAETKSEKVNSLVYVTALAPNQGEKVTDVFYRTAPHPKAPKLSPDSYGLIYLPHDAFAGAFAQNATTEEQEQLAAVQRPIASSCITVPVGQPLWKDRPSYFLLAEQDRMIVKETQLFMAKRMKAKVRTHPIDHTPSVSAPSVVVDIILEALQDVPKDAK